MSEILAILNQAITVGIVAAVLFLAAAGAIVLLEWRRPR